MAEFLLLPQIAKQALQARPSWPENGTIALPEAPGLGIEVAAERIDRRREVAWSAS
jgi:L-alanine-DL-glutamate epimerase-like enolase superfamily enzyme